MKRILIIGPAGCGKTAFCHAAAGLPTGCETATGMPRFIGAFLDTPGVYLDSGMFYSALITCAQQVDEILFMVASDSGPNPFPQGFAGLFSKPVGGIVSKADLIPEPHEMALRALMLTGAAGPFKSVTIKNRHTIQQWLIDHEKE